MAVKIYNVSTKKVKVGAPYTLKIWTATQDQINLSYPYLSAGGPSFDWKQYGYQTLTINPQIGTISANFDMGENSKREGSNPYTDNVSLFTLEYIENLDITSDLDTEATWTVLDSNIKSYPSNYYSYEMNLSGTFQGQGWYRCRHQYDPDNQPPRYGLSLICEVDNNGEILSSIFIRDTQPTNTNISTTTISSTDIN